VGKTQFLYDDDGNQVQTTQLPTDNSTANSQVETTLYGYNNRFAVAKISGVAYSAIPQSLIADIKTKSNLPWSQQNQDSLQIELNKLYKQFPNAMITTYTYNPVYGLTSTTDQRRHTIYKEYDVFGRPTITKEKKEAGGFSILSENKYNTRPN
jgi:hypothetical protein